MELSNRLETIASFVTEGYVVADIGTDHGYIPIYLTSNGNCPRAYAMDVNKEPLSRAKTHIEEENAGEVVSCILSDGLHELPQDDVDSIVIAGMGGDLVVRILEQDFDKLANVKELILSPQSHLERVRHFLNNHGFRILEEEFLKEDGIETVNYVFNDSNDITAVTEKAVSDKVDVIYIPTDNTAAANTQAIANVVLPAGIPVFAGEEGVCTGCGVATLTISYYDIGFKTGEMAADILLNGADISTMEIESAPQFFKKFNKTNAEKLGITIPKDYVAIEE